MTLPRGRARSSAFALATLVALLGATGACSSSSSSSSDAGAGPSDAGTVSCANDPRAMTYAANLTQMGQNKALQLVLVASDPAPPSRGNDTWTVRVVDTAGNAVTGATLTVKAFMPDHGHGSSVVPQISEQPDGSFQVTPLYLFMPGLWQITFDVTTPAASDTVVFSFCVAG